MKMTDAGLFEVGWIGSRTAMSRRPTAGDQVDPALEGSEVPWSRVGEVTAEPGP
jgi:hypothetical protein